MSYEIITDKKLIGKVCGERKGIDIVMGISMAIMIFMELALLALIGYYLFGLKRTKDVGTFIGCFLFMALFLLWFIWLSRNKRQHSRELKKKFKKLHPEEKQEILLAARDCGSNQSMHRSEHFIYGNLIRTKNARQIANKVLVFEFIRLTDIAWIHLRNTSQPVEISVYDYSVTGNIGGLDCCVYTYQGECYRGAADEDFYEALKQDMMNINPSCKFGYSKELEEQMSSLLQKKHKGL